MGKLANNMLTPLFISVILCMVSVEVTRAWCPRDVCICLHAQWWCDGQSLTTVPYTLDYHVIHISLTRNLLYRIYPDKLKTTYPHLEMVDVRSQTHGQCVRAMSAIPRGLRIEGLCKDSTTDNPINSQHSPIFETTNVELSTQTSSVSTEIHTPPSDPTTTLGLTTEIHTPPSDTNTTTLGLTTESFNPPSEPYTTLGLTTEIHTPPSDPTTTLGLTSDTTTLSTLISTVTSAAIKPSSNSHDHGMTQVYLIAIPTAIIGITIAIISVVAIVVVKKGRLCITGFREVNNGDGILHFQAQVMGQGNGVEDEGHEVDDDDDEEVELWDGSYEDLNIDHDYENLPAHGREDRTSYALRPVINPPRRGCNDSCV